MLWKVRDPHAAFPTRAPGTNDLGSDIIDVRSLAEVRFGSANVSASACLVRTA